MGSTHPLRFGVVAGGARSGADWLEQARRVEALGYDELLVPDTAFTPSPFPALAAAAAVTTTIALGTWVLAAPLRTPGAVVRDASALQLLSDGRAGIGIGAGRPDAEREAAALGVAWGTPRERAAQVLAVVDAVRAQVSPRPRIAVAAAGPRMLRAAGRLADRVALALPPLSTPDDLARAADLARAEGDPELAFGVVAVAGRPTAYLARPALDPDALAGAATALTGDAADMAEQLRRVSACTGVTSFPVPAEFADEFAEVVRLLRP